MVTWIIAGLGNPGRKYDTTRHNAGFLTVDFLANTHKVKVNKLKFEGLCGEMPVSGGPVTGVSALLLMPQTYMNESGRSIRRAMDFYKLPSERLLVIFDDVSLPPGKLRLRGSGSDGGHNGIKSIIYHLGTDSFPRVKIGVGSPPNPEYDLADWVLSTPAGEDAKLIGGAIERAADAVMRILTDGVNDAMNRYN